MNSPLCLWLAEVEDGGWRMIHGVFRFTIIRLPEWVYRTLLDTVGPATVRLIRVLIVFSLWLAIVLGPTVAVAKLNLPYWGLIGSAWTVLAIAGSIWGRYCIVRKRRAAEEMAEAGQPCLNGLSPRSECLARS